MASHLLASQCSLTANWLQFETCARYEQILWQTDRVVCLVFLRIFLSTIKAFSKVVSLVNLTTFIHPFFSVYHIYSPVQVFK